MGGSRAAGPSCCRPGAGRSLADGRPPSGIAAVRKLCGRCRRHSVPGLLVGDPRCRPVGGAAARSRSHQPWCRRYRRHRVLRCGSGPASRSMGYAIMGDLTFLHDANGLLIGPDEPRPDLCVIVLNDDGGGSSDCSNRRTRARRRVRTGLRNAARSGHRGPVRSHSDATRGRGGAKLAAALAPRPGLRVVEVVIDRHGHRDLFGRLRVAVAEALG